MNEHKPCPFCGGTESIYMAETGIAFYVRCEDCGCSGPFAYTEDTTWAAWDARATQPDETEEAE